jgi:thiol:disulfide interchange protein DsbC
MKFSVYIFSVVFLFVFAGNSQAFMGEGCGAGECKDCHTLTKEEAASVLQSVPGEVVDVKFSEVPGLWVVDLDQQGRKIPIYLDFSKQFVISGSVVRLATREDMTEKRFLALNKADISRIPLEDALIIGQADAAHRIIVFDDPECAYCKKLHDEMKAVVSVRSDIAFYIKMFPLVGIHPKAYDKAKAILCEKSLQLLEDSLNGKDLSPPRCETDQVDKNLALGRAIYVKSTPTLIMEDGSVMPGFKDAKTIIEIVDSLGKEPKEEKEASAGKDG